MACSTEQMEELCSRISEYKVGDFGEQFFDAKEGEMEGCRLNIALFGMTGSGKSALINTIFQSLGIESQPAVTQSTGKEGTKILETFVLPGTQIELYDTRGFFELDKKEEGELFRILFGIERPGDDLSRGVKSAQKALDGGVAAHKLERPPMLDQIHVVLWVIKANDVRFQNRQYRDSIKFVQDRLKHEAITIITVITFDDIIQKKSNADEEREILKKAAIEITGSHKRNVFFIANSVGAQEDQDLRYKERVLKMLELALKCGERSIRMRQTSREGRFKKQVRYSEPVKYPLESAEPPEYKERWSMLGPTGTDKTFPRLEAKEIKNIPLIKDVTSKTDKENDGEDKEGTLIRSKEQMEEDISKLCGRISEYKIGDCGEEFRDAKEGEMENCHLNIALFGMTGSGKSALINTIFHSLGMELQPAVTHVPWMEGTTILETFVVPGTQIVLYDTRGFFELDKKEEEELFRILFGIGRPGDDLSRDVKSAQKAQDGGVAAHKLERPSLSDQIHVVLWVIKANDAIFQTGKYRESIKFVQQVQDRMKHEAITIITVITFDDIIQKKSNADEEREILKKSAIEGTGSHKRNVFFIANSVGAQEDQGLEYKERVLKMLELALKCGERSIRMRQTRREGRFKKQARYSEPVKYPLESAEPPEYKERWSMLGPTGTDKTFPRLEAKEIKDIPLTKGVTSKTDKENDGEKKKVKLKVASDHEVDITFYKKKTLIRRGEVSYEGDTWNLEEAAALITFRRGAVKQPLLFSCSLWSPRTLSPPLGSNELLVSNVIELSHGSSPDTEFSGGDEANIIVALLHSASNLKGYEVVIKQLVDPENNEWKDLETTNIWHTSAKTAAPNWLFPCAEVTCTITRHSTFAAIWRLKSFVFQSPKSMTPEFSCAVPDYPDVSVRIPWNSVFFEGDFYLTLKVQEFPSSELKGEGLLISPVLQITSSQNLKCVEPVTINIPLSLREGRRQLAQLFRGCVRILHSDSGDETNLWEDITENLEEPAVITEGIVSFKVKHFSRFVVVFISPFLSAVKAIAPSLSRRSMPQQARFLACLCKTNVPGLFGLTVYCYPNILQDEIDRKLAKHDVPYQGQTNSQEPLCKGDTIWVSLSPALVRQDAEVENDSVTFLGDDVFDLSGSIVSIRSDSVPQVKFFKSQDSQECEHLCKVTLLPASRAFPQSSLVPTSSNVPRERPRVNKEISINPNPSSLPSEAVDLPSELRKRVLKVTLLGDEWGSSKGGLSTINRELAKQLSANPEVKVTVFIPKSACDEDEKEMARNHGINIVEAQQLSGYNDPLDWLVSPPDKLVIDILIGHGVRLGRQAQIITKSHKCKWVQVVHTAPDQLSMHKDYSRAISKGEEKNKTEVALCEEADLVVTIGPKLKEAFSVSLRCSRREHTVFSITPGTFAEFYCVKYAPADAAKFYLLVFGRCDQEDLSLKGYDIAAKAMAELDDKSYHLTVLGATDGKQKELVQTLVNHGISRSQLTVNTFCKDRTMLGKLFSQKDLVIMPSRTEGFGLTGLEALSAGLPILVSGNSGFAEALKKVPFGELYVVDDFENAKAWAKKIRAVRQKDRAQRLEEIKALRKFYEEKYSWEKQCEDLVVKMTSIIYAETAHSRMQDPDLSINWNINVWTIVAILIGVIAVLAYFVL